jgi:hypothetical protein
MRLATLTVMLAAGAVLPAGPAAAGRPATAPTTDRRGGSAADTVLAVVGAGHGGPGRSIGRSAFLHGWSQLEPPARPDSLTPVGARRFLDLLVDKEALGLMAARERWTWTARESASYHALEDRLAIEAALDSAMAAARRSLGPAGDTLGREALGVVARERAVARLAPLFDDSLLARLARDFAALPRPTSDSSLAAQLRMMGARPRVDLADSARVVARSAAGDYRVTDLLAAWARLSPIYRPRIGAPDQVRDLVTNGLFERVLRRQADSLGLARSPATVARLAAQREFNDVSHLVGREVYERITTDSLTLLRCYRATESDWTLPTRVRLVRMVLGSRAEAGAMAVRLAGAAEAESLAAQGARAGLRWTADLSAGEDSALFARAMHAGPGAVLGPEETAAGWQVARVMAVLPGRGRPFAEVRELVAHRWYGEEGERLMRALVSRARAGLSVRVNEPALAALLAVPPGAPAASRRRGSPPAP